MHTRRKFLLNCSVAAASASLTPLGAMAADRRHRELAPGQMTGAHFAGRLHTPFTVRTESGTLRLHLIEVNRPPASWAGAEDAGNERFSLLFRGPAGPVLDQDVYAFEHPGIGRFAMFIVLVGCLDAAHCYYEAVFNHPLNPADFAAQINRAPKPDRNP